MIWFYVLVPHSLHLTNDCLFNGNSTVPEVPQNWTKGKLLGAGAFGQVKFKLHAIQLIQPVTTSVFAGSGYCKQCCADGPVV